MFVATNLVLLGAAFVGLTFFGFFFDIFASVGFVSLMFGLCACTPAFSAGVRSVTATSCPNTLRAGPMACGRPVALRAGRRARPGRAARRRREYRRRLRRFLYAGSDAVMLEGVVERKSWLHEALSDLMVLVWNGDTERAARDAAIA